MTKESSDIDGISLAEFGFPKCLRILMRLCPKGAIFIKWLLKGAMTDITLTALLNRLGFETIFANRVKGLLKRNPGLPVNVFMIFFDLDNFKKVNDQYGYTIGDSVLVQVARHLRSGIHSETEILCRPGGDEFLMVLFNVDRETVVKYADALVDRMSADDTHMKFGHFRVSVTAGIRSEVIRTVSEIDRKRLRLTDASSEAMHAQKNRRKMAGGSYR